MKMKDRMNKGQRQWQTILQLELIEYNSFTLLRSRTITTINRKRMNCQTMHPVSPIHTRTTTATPKKNQTTESRVNPASSPSTPLMPQITTPTVRTTSSFSPIKTTTTKTNAQQFYTTVLKNAILNQMLEKYTPIP